MRETVAKRRPMIDLEQFERRLRQPNGAERPDEDALAELARLVGRQDDPYKAVFDQKTPPASLHEPDHRGQYSGDYESDYEATPYAAASFGAANWPETNRSGRVGELRPSGGDFASTETGPTDSRPLASTGADDFTAADDGFEDWREPDEAYPAQPPYQGETRSRRPLYIMAAIIVAGIAGIGASFALKGGQGTHQIATIRPADGPFKVQPETTGGSDAPNQDASILNRTPQAAPVAIADGAEQPVDLSRMPDHGPRVIAMNGGAASVPAPPPPGHAQTPSPQPSAEPLSIASLIEPKKVKTISVRPDGTLIQNDRPPQSTGAAAQPAAGHPAAPSAAKAATPKSTARVATTPKPASPAAPTDAGTVAAAAKAKPAEVAEAEAGAAQSASPSGSYAAQLAAPDSEQEARDIQSRLIKKYGAQIPGFHPSIRKAVSGDKTVYRVRSLGLSKEEATALCQKIQGSGGACFVAKN